MVFSFAFPPRRCPRESVPFTRASSRKRLARWMSPLIALALLSTSAASSAKDDKKKEDGKAQKASKTSKEDEKEKAPKDDPAETSSTTTDEASASASLSSGELSDEPLTGEAAAAHGPGNTIIFFDGGIRAGNGTLLQRETVGRLEQEENTDVRSVGPMFHAGVLTKLFWQFRVGVAFGYGFNYALKERLTPQEREQEQEPQIWVLGQLHTVDARLEFSQRLGDGFFVVATPRGGLSMIGVGEDLKALTNELEGSHVVRQGPRLGILLGGDVGVRYMFRPWFSLRLTGGYSYTLQSLLKATRRGDAADSDRTWRSSMARFGSNLAMEASF